MAFNLNQSHFDWGLYVPSTRAVETVLDLNSTSSIVLFSALCAVVIYSVASFFSRRSLKSWQNNTVPRGPRGVPMLGSFPFLTHYPELTLDHWAKRFGDLYSIWLGNQLFIIVSNAAVAKDLLVTNGTIFSSRKKMFIKAKTIFAMRGITATPYNDRWRQHRRVSATWLNQRAVDGYTATIYRESMSLLKALSEATKGGTIPVNPQPHAGRFSLNNMTTITFGFRTDSIDHPFVHKALRLNREFMNCTGPMSNLVDFVPFLQYLPSKMHSRAQKLHNDIVEGYGGLLKDVEKRMRNGEGVQECLAKTIVQVREKEKLDDLDVTFLVSAFLIGGVETTAAIIQWFCAMIPAYPEVQRKAHEELDHVVGHDRLPTVEDGKNLPYCHAIIKEVERMHNPFWLGTPHASTEDIIYKGHFIPKNSVVVLNCWTMHRDPSRYPDPDCFHPERYISDPLSSAESANLADPLKRDHWMFGAGRRICPGMLLAEREIWLSVSRILWAFEMTEMPGEPIDLKEYDGLSGRSPVPFRIRLTPRHDNVEKMLKDVVL